MLKNNYDKNWETHDFETIEDHKFRSSRSRLDEQADAHHIVTRHSAPQNIFPEFLKGRILTQRNPLSEEPLEAQKTTSQISINNNLPIVEETFSKQKSDYRKTHK